MTPGITDQEAVIDSLLIGNLVRELERDAGLTERSFDSAAASAALALEFGDSSGDTVAVAVGCEHFTPRLLPIDEGAHIGVPSVLPRGRGFGEARQATKAIIGKCGARGVD